MSAKKKVTRRAPGAIAFYPLKHDMELTVMRVRPGEDVAEVGMVFGQHNVLHAVRSGDAEKIGRWFLHLAAHLKPKKAGAA